MGIQPFKRDRLKHRVCELYQAGHTYREIAKMIGLSHETARKMWMSTQVKDIA